MKRFCMARMGGLAVVGLHAALTGAVLGDAAAELSIAVSGETNACVIVIPKGTAEAERYAAEATAERPEERLMILMEQW